ncbi:MAG: hypothetical protein NVSMB47_05470 [Polyangiales bacterium]
MPPRSAKVPRSTAVEELARLLSRARRRVYLACAQALSARGGSMLTFQLLAHLVVHGASTQVDLATATAQHPAGISRLLDELERDALVRRRRDPTDRRKLRVEATATGRARFRMNHPILIAAVDDALGVLSVAERKALATLLRKLTDASSG